MSRCSIPLARRMFNFIGALLSLSLLTSLSPAHADAPAPLVLDLPLLDVPFNTSNTSAGYTAPSMRQSLLVTKNFYQFAHHEISALFTDHPGLNILAIIGFDFLFTWLPPGDSWLHEEWHRAVLGRYGISSYNDVYDLPLFADSIAVSHVNDADLVRLKRTHPADQVRLSAAGIEAQYEFILALEKDAFFESVRNRNGFLLWTNLINSIAYLDACAGKDADVYTNEAYVAEGANVKRRDFTGLDCNAWVYDLFRPDEAYASRGTHPSGIGIDRYISWSDLNPAEQSYLRRQRNLSWLNLIDPFLFGHVSSTYTFPGTQTPLHWNAALRHHLTSFGYSLDTHLFLRSEKVKALGIFHLYRNQHHAFPGVSVELQRFPLLAWDRALHASTTLALWQQPQAQKFNTRRADLGGQLSGRVDFPLQKIWGTYVEADVKTAGWVAGNVYLDANASLRLGVTARW